jgi:membrane protein
LAHFKHLLSRGFHVPSAPAGRDPRGTDATSPWAIPGTGWKEVLLRSWRESSEDNVGLVAAGVAFYGFLALVPLLGAVVLSYGLIAEPETVMRNMQQLTAVMPGDAAKLIGEQLMNVVTTSEGKKGFGVLLALAIALFGARNGAGSIMTALNIAYEEKEKRGFVMVNLTALAITAGGVLVAILAVIAITALGHLDTLLPDASGVLLAVGKLLTYALLLFGGAAGAATLYRFGPSRDRPRWVWLTPGSLLAALLWLLLTLGFGLYVANFGNYNATYGSLSAVVVLLTWLYLSSYILLFGAELNSELEHQTAQDTTKGASKPMGERGAWVADHVAGADGKAAPASAPTLAPEPVAHVEVQHTSGGTVGGLAAAATASKTAKVAGLPGAGLVLPALATTGLALLKSRRRAWYGVALLASSAGAAWLGREREPTS